MLRIKNWCFMIALVVGLCGPLAKGQSTVTAASCNQSDVNAVINGPTHKAVNGDIINVPSGSCTWTSGINISGVGISIIGAGTPNTGTGTTGAGTSTTTITMNAAATYIFKVTGISYGQTVRFSLMNLSAGASADHTSFPLMTIGTCTSSGCPNLRIDNVTFDSSWQNANLFGASLTIDTNVFGVLDHNTVTAVANTTTGPALANISHSSWQGVGSYGDNSWATADTFGTAQALYLENNLFTNAFGTDTDESDVLSDIGGGRFVCRYNRFNGVTSASACTNHGSETGGRFRGGRQFEAYGNTLVCTSASAGCNSGFGSRSGSMLVFNNTFSCSPSCGNSNPFYNSFVAMTVVRAYRNTPPWGSCDGAGPWDTNDGTVYGSGTVSTAGTGTFSISTAMMSINQWAGSAVTSGTPYSIHDVTQGFGDEIASNTTTQYTFTQPPLTETNGVLTWNAGDSYQILRATVCIDQPGRGRGIYISGASGPGGGPTTVGSVGNVLDPVYEWGDTVTSGHLDHEPISTGGNTNRLLNNRDYYYQVSQLAQTSPTSPFNGTVGTGYGTLANRPTTCSPVVAYWATDQNTLYKCTTTNTWTEFYQPYTYPHPLTGGTSTVTVNPPTGLAATVQ